MDRAERAERGFLRVGGFTVLLAVAVVLAEIAIGFLPGAARLSPASLTVTDWFLLFQNNAFLGLRDLGLMNLIGAALLAPTFFALRLALKGEQDAAAAFATTLFFVGIAVYVASNRGFAMLSLSREYLSAPSDAERQSLVSAGRAMLVEGQSRAGIVLIECAGLLISAVMARGQVFGRAAAYTGILGNALMIALEIILGFAPLSIGTWSVMAVAIAGGLSTVFWYTLLGRRLLQLGAS